MLPKDYAVLAVVRLPETGEVHSVIYDFAADAADVVPLALPEDTRVHQGVPVPWRKEQSWELIHRAPAGEWGAADVSEVHGFLAARPEDGFLLLAAGRPVGRLINIGQVEQLLAMDRATMDRRLGHIGTGRGARVLHDGHGLIYRIIKDKPEVRARRA